jgi:hypothetical protein
MGNCNPDLQTRKKDKSVWKFSGSCILKQFLVVPAAAAFVQVYLPVDQPSLM